MNHPMVVHCKRSKDQFVYIGRPSKWGNPFIIGRDGTREEVIRKHREWLLNNTELLQQIHELRGKKLGCYCAPHPCHGDTLAEFANTTGEDTE